MTEDEPDLDKLAWRAAMQLRSELGPQVHRHEHGPTNVTVKRAPTDDSVRLLKEMEKAAQDKLISSVRVESNAFKCVVHQCLNYEADDVKLRAIFDLNGKQMTVEVEGAMRERREDERVIWRRLVDAIAKEIATQAIEEAFRAYIRR